MKFPHYLLKASTLFQKIKMVEMYVREKYSKYSCRIRVVLVSIILPLIKKN